MPLWRQQLSPIIARFNQEQRIVLNLRLKGERRMRVYARSLDILHLALHDQIQYVRRVTNSVSHALRRGAERLRKQA